MPKDKIELSGMVFYGFHGASPSEQELGQRFVVDLDLYRGLGAAGRSDDLADTVNYADVYRTVKDVLEGPSRKLLENVATAIAELVLSAHDVEAVRVRVKKPEAPIKGSVLDYAGVEIFRESSPRS